MNTKRPEGPNTGECVRLRDEDAPRGLGAWMPPENSPHLYAYSNLLRQGVPEPEARRIIEDQLIAAGMATLADFGREA